MEEKSNDPLHGKTLEVILTDLVALYGWNEMSKKIRINCFSFEPSIKSSLSFLRKTPWARQKVEVLYTWSIKKIAKMKLDADAHSQSTQTPPPSKTL
jgi:uncharacterized protein (DUF2132 family)